MRIDSRTHAVLLSELLTAGPVGFTKLLQRMGPTYIKIGQFLALRPDLIPQAYCDELLYLLDRVPPFTWQEAREILCQDLARDPLDTFASVDPEPVAAGSFAQVHKGRLRDGTVVAIKIQRPGIRDRVYADLRQAKQLTRLLQHMDIASVTSARALLKELRTWMIEELDMERELSNLIRLQRLARSSPIQIIPRPYPHLCSKRVLVTTYVHGVRFTDILTEIRSRTDGHSPTAEAAGLDLRRLAENLFQATLIQVFRHRFFHADLHPGNLFAVGGNLIGYVDFGLCAELEPAIREKQLRYFEAVYSGRTQRIVKALVEVLGPTNSRRLEAFRRDATAVTNEWVRQRNSDLYGTSNTGGRRTATGQWLIDLMRLARTHRMEIPSRTLSLYRALLTAETVASELHFKTNFRAVTRRAFASPLMILEGIQEGMWRSHEENSRLFRSMLQANADVMNEMLRAMADSAVASQRRRQKESLRPLDLTRCVLEDLADAIVNAIRSSGKANSRLVDRFYKAYKTNELRSERTQVRRSSPQVPGPSGTTVSIRTGRSPAH